MTRTDVFTPGKAEVSSKRKSEKPSHPMGGDRRRKNRNKSTADITASTPEQVQNKKLRSGGDDDDAESIRTILSKNPYSNGGTAINDSDLDGFGDDVNNQQQQQQQIQVRVPKIPPLMVKSVGLGRLKEVMASLNIDATFKICRIGIKVVLSTMEDYTKAKQYLDKNKVEFFTFDVPAEKPFKAVIRGLPITDVDEIKSDLELRYKLKPLAIFPMARHSRVEEYRDCLYLVHFPKGSVSLGALQAVNRVTQIIVSWEAYRGANKDVTQCTRCLNFGHGTRNCRMKARCDLCTKGHPTDSCPIEGAVAYKCANCRGPHRSTNRVCPKREEYKRIRKQASTSNQPGRRTNRGPPSGPDHFPPLRHEDRNAPILAAQWNRRQPSPAPRSGPRPGEQRSFSPERPGFQRSPLQREPEVDDNASAGAPPRLYTAADLQYILNEMCDKLQQCTTRLEQVRLIGNLVLTYGY